MLLITHLLFALVLGKALNHTIPIVIGALIIDLDHFYYLWKSEKANVKTFLKQAISQRGAPTVRTFFHSIPGWILTSAVAILINAEFGIFFSLGYISHLALDSLDGSKTRFLYPFSNIVSKGPIEYNSYGEYIIIILLVLIYSIML